VFSSRASWSKKVDQSELGDKVLASLSNVNASVDIRIRFDEHDAVSLSVPVAILHFQTDTDSELFCQATQWQLEHIIGKLEKTLGRLKQASDKIISDPSAGTTS
jgi:hypothetical protein